MSGDANAKELRARAGARYQAGDLEAARALYTELLEADPDDGDVLHRLGALNLGSGRMPEAVAFLERAVGRATAPDASAALHQALGEALSAVGRHGDALAHYRLALKDAPQSAAIHAALGGEFLIQGDAAEAVSHFEAALSLEIRAGWHHQLGRAHAALHHLQAAEHSYRAALALKADCEPALYDLGLLLHAQRERPFEAIALLERLRALNPTHAEAHRALGHVLRSLHRHDQAIECYRRYAGLVPDSATAPLYLGTTLMESGRPAEAFAPLEKAAVVSKSMSAIAHVEIGNAFLRTHRPAAAHEAFLRGVNLQPVIVRKATAPQALFAALMVVAPGAANTPYEYLVGRRHYDAHFLSFVLGATYDEAVLRGGVDVVVNLISDADQGRPLLPLAASLVDRLGKPIINHPRLIARTDRVAVAQTLSHIADCRVARVERWPATALRDDKIAAKVSKFGFPFLARLAGRHGGDAFEKIESADQLRVFTGNTPTADYYLMDYLDYRSADGFFRKYRFFCVGGEVLPYHLAISQHWKVHHFSTDMKSHMWMQKEEGDFLASPDAVFSARALQVLHEVTAAIGLDFMGIDCGLDRNGTLVVFEANAVMLVNGNTHAFPYKMPAVRRIKAAFDAMLTRLAKDSSPTRQSVAL